MTRWKQVVLVLATLLVLTGCDQKTKSLASAGLRDGDTRSFLAGTVRLVYSENPGGFLGLGDTLPTPWRTAVFTIFCAAASSALLLYTLLVSQSGWFHTLALSLICAGGIGNVIDRWAYGYTRDFLNVGIGPLRTGIFNVADVALMCGCFLIFLGRWLDRPAHGSSATGRS